MLLYFGPRERLGYDSFWHVFIARLDDWRQFAFEIADNAHPPLYYLVLKAATLLGSHVFVYRLPSMISIVVATWLMARVAGRLVDQPWLPVIAAVTFGLSQSAIEVGLEVRAYALATCLTLAAMWYYVRLAETGFAGGSRANRAGFTLFLTLALLTHYSVVFVALAAGLSPFLLRALGAGGSKAGTAPLRDTWRANMLTFGAPLGVFAVFYVGHARYWSHRIQHLPEFMFDPARESVLTFAGRTLRAELGLLTPAGPIGPVLIGAAVLMIAALLVASRRMTSSRRAVALLFPTMLAVIVAVVLAASLAGRYPFGGPVRHQFFVLPFAILTLVVSVDRVGSSYVPAARRSLLTAALAVACVPSIAWWAVTLAPTTGLMYQRQVNAYRATVADTRAVYLDQFSLIPFFMHHHQWTWHMERGVSTPGRFGVWTVSRGDERFRMCRDRSHWELDLSDAALYGDLMRCLEVTGAPTVAVFRLRAASDATPRQQLVTMVDEKSRRAGLTPVAVTVKQKGVFAAFERSR